MSTDDLTNSLSVCEITNIDKLQPVHHIILDYIQHIDPITCLRLSQHHYKTLIPAVYEKIELTGQNVDSMMIGMTDVDCERFRRGQSKLHALRQIKTLKIEDSQSVIALHRWYRIFLSLKVDIDVKGKTPFEGVEYLELGWKVLYGHVASVDSYRLTLIEHPSPGRRLTGNQKSAIQIQNNYDGTSHEVTPIHNASFHALIRGSSGGTSSRIRRLCVEWGDWNNILGGDVEIVSGIGSRFIRILIRSLILLREINIFAQFANIDKYCNLIQFRVYWF
ncbi:uncharacterized protein L201_005165 [Kwoniella dendrophila CBS 6074]|uniref:F-box domain-containing protein n=1 Tax=Kwoniella dendrophila CBS 6074 TaxID=1295534 RepID=A0AAX4JYA0_9TREE